MPPLRSLAAAALLVAAGLAFTVFRPPATGGPIERDFEAYDAAGAAARSGHDPYSRAIWTYERRIPGVDAARDELLPFVGPAAALPWWSLLSRFPYPIAVGAWTVVLLSSLGAIVAAAVWLAPRPGGAAPVLLTAAIAFTAAPAIGSLALGQAALVAAAGIALALVSFARRRPLPAFAATLVAAIQPNLALALAARVRTGWEAAVAAAAAAAFAVLSFVAGGGPAGLLTYLARLGAHAAAERTIAIQHTPAAVAYGLGVSLSAAQGVATIVAAGALVALVIAIRRERLDALTAALVGGALLPLMLPFFHEPDFVLELLPLLVLARRARGRARALAAVAAVMLLVDWFGFAQRTPAQGQILCLGLAVAAGFVALAPVEARSRRPGLAGAAILLVLAALAVPAGRAHPAPTWPAQLPAEYRAPSTADASVVWGDEQRAAGLDRRDPIWAGLRAIPLVGCVVLAAALIADARRRDPNRSARRRLPPLAQGSHDSG